MEDSFKIRPRLTMDYSAIVGLIYSTSLKYCFTLEQPCPEWFKESVSPSQILSQLSSEQLTWLVAEENQLLIGVLTISDKCNVKYFFVHPAHQKKYLEKTVAICI